MANRKVAPSTSDAPLNRQQSEGVKKLRAHRQSNPKTANTNKRKGIETDDRTIQVILSPHEREWKYMQLPSVTTLTIFEETKEDSVKLVEIYDRVAAITKKNPWLTGRLRMQPDGISLFYGNNVVDCFESFTRKNRVDFDCKYEKLIDLSKPYAVKQGRDCVDQNEPLFKVTCLIVGEVKKQLTIVFSLSSVIGDAYTFYQIYAMLDKKNEIKTLDCKRELKYLDALKSNVGSSNYNYTDTAAAFKYNSRTFLSRFLWKRQKTIVHYIDEDVWLKKAKKNGKKDQVEVSTNDCLTSWFFKMCNCTFGVMKVNFRNKVLDIDDMCAGNYTNSVLYRPDDFETPFLMRLSLGDKHVRRAARVQIGTTETIIGTTLPSFMQTQKNNSALSSNWYSVSRYITFEGCKQTLHIPIIDKKEEPYKHIMLIFQATPSTMGAIIIGRGLVMDENDFPLDKGILKKSSMKFDDIYKPTAKISTLNEA
jgi:hypothetical protein